MVTDSHNSRSRHAQGTQVWQLLGDLAIRLLQSWGGAACAPTALDSQETWLLTAGLPPAQTPPKARLGMGLLGDSHWPAPAVELLV